MLSLPLKEEDDTIKVQSQFEYTMAGLVFNYSPTLTYPTLVYEVYYGFMDSLLGFTTQH